MKSNRTKGTLFQSTTRSNSSVSMLERIVINDGIDIDIDMDGSDSAIDDGDSDDSEVFHGWIVV